MPEYALAHIAGGFLTGERDELILSREIAPDGGFQELWMEMLEEASELGLTLVMVRREAITTEVSVRLIAEQSVLSRAAVAGANGLGIGPLSLADQERGVRSTFFRSFGFSPGLCDSLLQEAVAEREAQEIRAYRARGFFQYGAEPGTAEQGGLPDVLWNHPRVIVACAARQQIPGYLGAPSRRRDVDRELVTVWLEHSDLDRLADWIVSMAAWEFMSFARPNLAEELARIRALIPEEAQRVPPAPS